MLRFFTLFALIYITTLTAEINFAQHQTTIKKMGQQLLYIEDSDNFSVGSSGIVLHEFDQTHKTIVSMVEVIEKKDGWALLWYKNFNSLKQRALPSYNITPKEGDTVILNYLYERAMAIVPNSQTLKYITKKHDRTDWIHPDIFAAKLTADYEPVPTKENFQNECRENSFALVFFAIEDSGYFLDCYSFKIVHKIDLPKELNTKESMVPFYSRMKKIKGRMFGLMGGDGINDYNRYYKQLLGIK